jgi:hypothetical protein
VTARELESAERVCEARRVLAALHHQIDRKLMLPCASSPGQRIGLHM